MQMFLPILYAYLIGSISFSYLYGTLVKGIDIRKHGSGNAGATNTLRVLGKKPALFVLLLDISKGLAAVWIGSWLSNGDEWTRVLCGLSVIIGHNWPVFHGFKGGKGVATTIGVILMLCPIPALTAGFFGILSIVITRYVSLGSLVFTGLLPIAIWIMNGPIEVLYASLAIAVFAFVRHRTNMIKIIQGTESKLGSKSISS